MITAIGTPLTVFDATSRKIGELIGIGVCAIASSAPAAPMKVTSVMMNGAIPSRVIQRPCQRPTPAPARIVTAKASERPAGLPCG